MEEEIQKREESHLLRQNEVDAKHACSIEMYVDRIEVILVHVHVHVHVLSRVDRRFSLETELIGSSTCTCNYLVKQREHRTQTRKKS